MKIIQKVLNSIQSSYKADTINGLSEEIISSINRLSSLENEVTNLREQQHIIEEKLVALFDEINDAKTILFQHLQQPNEDCPVATITRERLDPNNEINDNIVPPIIIPKDLAIKGYENIGDNILHNLEKLINVGSTISTPCLTATGIGKAMAQCGKELILIKQQNKRSEREHKEAKDILETCRKIVEIGKSGDTNGYNKYVSFILKKYPLPDDPFQEDNPVDYFSNAGFSLYKNSFHLLYFTNKYVNLYLKINENYHSKTFRDYYSEDELPRKVELSEVFIKYLEMLIEFDQLGYEIAIIPILDENIQYRPRSSAQDDTCFSLLYYDKYVENPCLIDGDEVEQSRRSFSYTGSTYVSGHYRQGHYRNGYWVSGGYVRGYFRR